MKGKGKGPGKKRKDEEGREEKRGGRKVKGGWRE